MLQSNLCSEGLIDVRTSEESWNSKMNANISLLRQILCYDEFDVQASVHAQLALLLVWMAAPVMRCFVPGESLTAEEQACCKSMGGQCGDSPASDHPCCKHATSTSQLALPSSYATPGTSTQVVASMAPAINSMVEKRCVPAWLVDPSPPPDSIDASSVLGM